MKGARNQKLGDQEKNLSSALQYRKVKQRLAHAPWDSSKRQRRYARSSKKSTALLLDAIGLN